jgi:hypothetical protein
MDNHAGRITIIASSTMVHQRVRCMICGQPVDHRVVFMTNDARVLHAGCIPDHVKVPTTVLLQAIRRLERMVAKGRREDGALADGEDATNGEDAADEDPDPAGSGNSDPAGSGNSDPAGSGNSDPAGAWNPAAPNPNDLGPPPR